MMRPRHRRAVRAGVLALALMLFAAGPWAGRATWAADALERGPKVGATIPHRLNATDQNGRARDFKSLTGRRGLILIFSRSLDWCVYCKAEARDWTKHVGEVRALGYRLAILTYDKVADLASFAERHEARYTLLSDPKSEIIRAFGILNERHSPGSYAHGIPHPIIFVIDPKGIITHRFSETSYRDRTEIDVVLKALGKGGGS